MIIGELYPLPAGATGTPAAAINPTSLIMTNNGIEAIPAVGQGNVRAVRLGEPAGQHKSRHDGVPGAVGQQAAVAVVPSAGPGGDDDARAVGPAGDARQRTLRGHRELDPQREFGRRRRRQRRQPDHPAESSTTSPTTGVITSNISLLAVSGNVLLGTTNLGALLRSAAAGDTWLPYNSIGV